MFLLFTIKVVDFEGCRHSGNLAAHFRWISTILGMLRIQEIKSYIRSDYDSTIQDIETKGTVYEEKKITCILW